jgi:hypothetical protein
MPVRIELNGEIHEFPDGTTDEQIAQALGQMAPASSLLSRMKAGATPEQQAALDAMMQEGSQGPLDLAGAGATLATVPFGGSGGTLLNIGRAAVGGASGRGTQIALDQLRRREPPRSAGDVAADVAGSGLTQGAIETMRVPFALAKRAVTALGPRMVTSYLKPGVAMLRKRAGIEGDTKSGVMRKLTDFVIKEKLTSPEKAQGLVSSVGKQIDDTLAQAEAANPNLVLDTNRRLPRYLQSLLRRTEKQMLPGQDRTAIQNTGRELVEDSPLSRARHPSELIPRGSSRPRVLRSDVTPSEGMEMVRTRSYFDPTASGGRVAAGKTIERAVRDAIKARVPPARPMLSRQGRAIDATEALDAAGVAAGKRDTLGGFAQTMGAVNARPTIGLLMQLLKEGQLRGGVYSPEIAHALGVTGEISPSLLRGLLAISHRNEP